MAILISLVAPALAEEWTLTKLTDNDVDDRFSPYGMTADGNKIVYITDTDGNYATKWDREVFMMDLETLETERITDNIYQDLCAAISADGSKIAFVEIEPTSDTDSIRKVYVISKSNGWNQDYPVTTSSGYYSTCPILSADGRYLIFQEMFSDTGYDRFRIFDTITRNQVGAYTSVYDFCNWMTQSLDKSKVVYLEFVPCAGNPDKDCQRLHLMSTTSPFSDTIIYTTTGGTGVEEIWYVPSVSNDGKVAFYMESEFPGEGVKKGVFLYENGNIKLLTPTDYPAFVAISGDGSKVFYLGKRSGKLEIHRINTDGSGDELIATIEDVWAIGTPVVNYDGSKVVFELETWDEDDIDIYMVSQQTINIPGIGIELYPVFPTMTSVVAGSARATHGDIVQIPVEIKNADKVGSLDITLSYPSGILQFMDILPGSLTQNSLMEHNVEDGKIRVGIVEANGINGDGSLFYMKFKVIGEAEPVNISANIPVIGNNLGIDKSSLILPEILTGNNYNFFIEDLAIYTTDNTKVEALRVNGTFELISEEEANKGDVNGDGEITSVDALMALQMAVGKLEPKSVADMDDDGKVMANDAMMIMQLATEHSIRYLADMLRSTGGLSSFDNLGGGD